MSDNAIGTTSFPYTPSGDVLTIHIPMSFITGWPADPAFVTKGSGACLRDVSAGTGGFCILEDNDSET